MSILSRVRPADVEKWYRKGLTALPEDEALLSRYASFLLEKGRNEEALYRYLLLTHLFPTNTSYVVLLGNVYLTLELHDKALESYEKAKSLTKEPEDWIFANIGNLYSNRGFYSKAISYLNEALAIDANDEYSHKRLAAALELKASEEKKVVELEKKGQQAFLQVDVTKQGDLSQL